MCGSKHSFTMKTLFLSIALLMAMPTFSTQSICPVETNQICTMEEAPLATVCVGFANFTAGPNPAYFYTLECAELFELMVGCETEQGTFCVPEASVIICL